MRVVVLSWCCLDRNASGCPLLNCGSEITGLGLVGLFFFLVGVVVCGAVLWRLQVAVQGPVCQ